MKTYLNYTDNEGSTTFMAPQSEEIPPRKRVTLMGGSPTRRVQDLALVTCQFWVGLGGRGQVTGTQTCLTLIPVAPPGSLLLENRAAAASRSKLHAEPGWDLFGDTTEPEVLSELVHGTG
ncbi:hypothetical protein KUCAC02_025478 [Chaenocephalus aceratus]|uniref:Uncharacterized protein n=1 Tax=Chaenocephalus aceratus TaxID=36190 RepID=A0ACB9VV04_CHAAC|nr:hypothetical protein KUCAC02_025478 [Chaenocephalus aceratus]